jgi:hypothetical protein
MIFIALARVHLTCAPQEVSEIPRPNPPGRFVVEANLNIGVKHAEFFGLFQNIGNSRLLHVFGEKLQSGCGSF